MNWNKIAADLSTLDESIAQNIEVIAGNAYDNIRGQHFPEQPSWADSSEADKQVILDLFKGKQAKAIALLTGLPHQP